MNNVWKTIFFSFLMINAAFAFAGKTRLKVQDGGSYISGTLTLSTGSKVKFEVDMPYKDLTTVRYSSGDAVISGEINTIDGTVSITGESAQSGLALAANKSNKILFKDILTGFQIKSAKFKRKFKDNPRAMEGVGYLFKMTEYMTMLPENTSLNLLIKKPVATAGWTDLCRYYGKSRTAKWDVGSNKKQRSYKVGGHGWCAGRCGAGCIWFGDPQYSQDCLNHDACADREGEQLGVCGDEWTAASDDFWFSPDCPGVD